MDELVRQVQTLREQVATMQRWERPIPTRSAGTSSPTLAISDYGAKGDATTDDTTAIQAAISALPSSGGTLLLAPKRHKITSTLTIPSNTTLRGTWGGNVDNGGEAVNGSQFLWAGASNQPMLKIFNGEYIALDGFSLNGGGIAGVTGILIDSDNGASLGFIRTTHQISIRNFSIDNCGAAPTGTGTYFAPGTGWGTGIQLGTSGIGTGGNPGFQSDGLYIGQGRITGCARGIVINSNNSADYSIIENLALTNFAYGITIENGDYHKIGSIAGGVGINNAVFLYIPNGHNAVLIEQCQFEVGTATGCVSLQVDSNLVNYPITLISNNWDQPVNINGQHHVIGVGNAYDNNANLNLSAAGAYYLDIGDRFSTGSAPVLAAGAVYRKVSPEVPTWTTPTLLNSWTSVATVGYSIDELGVVRLKGRVTGGTAAVAIFTLPAGYRPPGADRLFAQLYNNGGADNLVRVTVKTTGDVVASITSTSFTSLDGISFPTF